MGNRGWLGPGTLGAARDRQALVFAELSRDPSQEFTINELHDRLWRHATRSQVRSAIAILQAQGLIERAFVGVNANRGATYRVAAPRSEALYPSEGT